MDPVFEEEQFLQTRSTRQQKYTGLVGLLINNGIVKTPTGATIVMVAVIVVCLGIVWFVGFGSGSVTVDENAPLLDPDGNVIRN